MSSQLENEARAAYEKIRVESRSKMGACVAALPDADELQEYLTTLRAAWAQGWCNRPARYPSLLLRLYHCVAFLRYEGGKFWPSFAATVGDSRIASDGNRQREINNVFAHIARHLGWEILHGAGGPRLCVQSAVRYVGIPVLVWPGFLQVCERLFREADDWQNWPDEKWDEALHLWLFNHPSLRAFFTDNRVTASQWIIKMLDARRDLEKHPGWSLDDIASLADLRPEYLDLPQTGLFLRWRDPESLFRDRPRLRLSEQSGVVLLVLEAPRVKEETMLPSEWHVLRHRVAASTNPVRIPLHRDAFAEELQLRLVRGEEVLSRHRLRGLFPWGLWSESSAAFISTQARELPVGGYLLVSKSQLTFVNRDGWLGDDEEETRWNVEMSMADGSTCFVSRLVMDARRAVLEVEGWQRITFAPSSRLELRVFPRMTERFFLTFVPPNSIALPEWPWFVLKIPRGQFARSVEETEALLQREFQLLADDARVPGDWRHGADASGQFSGEDIFFFKIRDGWLPPAHHPPRERVLRDFRDLGRAEPPPPTPVEVVFRLQSERHGVIPFGDCPEIRFKKEPPLGDAHKGKLYVPFSDYWPWYMLAATQDHATWEEIRLAFGMMSATNTPISYYPFQQIERLGFMVRRGHRWTDFENRILFGRHDGGACTCRYAGLTSAIYSVVREIEPRRQIVARWERGHPPHLEICFSLAGDTDRRLRQACQRAGIRIMHESLWTR
jgi:hypothetical protein